jgi:hypothetical protein
MLIISEIWKIVPLNKKNNRRNIIKLHLIKKNDKREIKWALNIQKDFKRVTQYI